MNIFIASLYLKSRSRQNELKFCNCLLFNQRYSCLNFLLEYLTVPLETPLEALEGSFWSLETIVVPLEAFSEPLEMTSCVLETLLVPLE
jgi:hypothetical protein